MDKQELFDTQYIPSAVRIGRITNSMGLVCIMLPCVAMLLMGYSPIWAAVGAALVIRLSSCALAYVIEPVSFYPGLGLAGSYMGNLIGSAATLGIPCGVGAVDALGIESGTPEEECVKAVANGVATLVKNGMLILTVILGTGLLNILPPSVETSMSYMIPALFGALIAGYIVKNWKLAFICLALSITMTCLVQFGVLSFMPFGVAMAVIIVISVFGSAAIGLKFFVPKGK